MNPLLLQTRRHFFRDCGVGVGSIALGSLLGRDAPAQAPSTNPLAARATHFPARAKSVIYLFMAGGPSQLELFDYKPQLQKLDGQPIPASYLAGKRFALAGKCVFFGASGLRAGADSSARAPPSSDVRAREPTPTA